MTGGHETPRLVALGFDFSIRTDDAALGRYLERVHRQLVQPGRPAHRYSLRECRDGGEPRYEVVFDDAVVFESRVAASALAHLLWHAGQQVVARSDRWLLIHASAVEHRGRAAIFPAPPESGKTTLCAGLAVRGYGYLTDEAVALDPATGRITPYPKPLALDMGSWGLFPGLAPYVEPGTGPYLAAQWHVEPSTIPGGRVGVESAPAFVVLPRYAAGSVTRLRPISRAETIADLGGNSLNLGHHGRAALFALSEVVASCACYRLDVGHLADACDLVVGLLEAP